MATDNNHILTEQEFVQLKDLALRYIGIKLNDHKREQLSYRFTRRLTMLKFSTFLEYINFIMQDSFERTLFINTITNVRTYFFREVYHFDYLKQELLPALLKRKKRIRIWSAGCATGEEPYSMAITILETLKDQFGQKTLENYDIKILATDVNTDAIEIAKQGIYAQDSIDRLGPRKQWFHTFVKEGISYVKVDEKLKSLIAFRYLNLLSPWPMKGSFDIIFCRNVMIYLSNEAISALLDKFYKYLDINGVLFIGFAESLNNEHSKYILSGNKIYQKIN